MLLRQHRGPDEEAELPVCHGQIQRSISKARSANSLHRSCASWRKSSRNGLPEHAALVDQAHKRWQQVLPKTSIKDCPEVELCILASFKTTATAEEPCTAATPLTSKR